MQQTLLESTTICFEVLGEPKSQGSTRVIPLRAKGGGYQMREDGRPKLVPIHDNAKALQSWRAEVVTAFRAAYNGPAFTGAVKLVVVLCRPRPAGHYGSGKNAANLKASAPTWPTTRPDTLKLVRGIEDALTGHAWKDDSQVVQHALSKTYGDRYQTTIEIIPLEEKTEEAF